MKMRATIVIFTLELILVLGVLCPAHAMDALAIVKKSKRRLNRTVPAPRQLPSTSTRVRKNWRAGAEFRRATPLTVPITC